MIYNTFDELFNSNKKWDLIYLDPPWQFKSWSKKGEGKSAQKHYDCMSMDDLARLRIEQIAEENAIMFMWATGPLLNKQISIMEDCWGFVYKTTGFTWVKTNPISGTPFFGLGYYTRSNPEFCLIGVKGSVGRPVDRSVSSVLDSPIREHSRKPDDVYSKLERMYPNFSKLEMFARQERKGWDQFGNQVDKFNSLFD